MRAGGCALCLVAVWALCQVLPTGGDALHRLKVLSSS